MSRLKYIFTIITLQSLFSAGICSAADISFKGTSKKVIDIEPEKDTGLDEINGIATAILAAAMQRKYPT